MRRGTAWRPVWGSMAIRLIRPGFYLQWYVEVSARSLGSTGDCADEALSKWDGLDISNANET